MVIKNYFNPKRIVDFIVVFCVISQFFVLSFLTVQYIVPKYVEKAQNEKLTNLVPIIPPTYPPNYPLNMDVTAYIGNPNLEESFVPIALADKVISVCSKVTYDEKTNQFNYQYKISTVAKETCFLSWEILDRVLNNGNLLTSNNNNLPKMVELDPEKTLEFSLTSSLGPALYEGNAWIYKKKSDHWELIPLKAQPGPLPRQE